VIKPQTPFWELSYSCLCCATNNPEWIFFITFLYQVNAGMLFTNRS